MKRQMTGKSARGPADSNGTAGTPNIALAGIPPEWRGYYVKLVAIRERLLREHNHQLQDVEEPLPPFKNHFADVATDECDRDVAIAELAAEESVLYEVNEAIRRVENGTYGLCEATGKPISEARLRAIPWARFSCPAEAQFEQANKLRD
jgi:RNA polymerase-binding transcription factor DksA